MAGKRKGRNSQNQGRNEDKQEADKFPQLFFMSTGAAEESTDHQEGAQGKHHIGNPIKIEKLTGLLTEEIADGWTSYAVQQEKTCHIEPKTF